MLVQARALLAAAETAFANMEREGSQLDTAKQSLQVDYTRSFISVLVEICRESYC